MKKLLTRATAVILTVTVAVMSAGCGATQPVGTSDVAAAAVPVAEGILVTTAAPSRGNMQLDTSFVGSVQPDQVVSVMPKTAGVVKTVHVSAGQTVKKGDLLLTLDDKDFMPSYKQAEAGYNSAKAQVQQMTGSSYKQGLSGLDTAYDQAFDAYENAKYELQEAEAKLAAETDPTKRPALQMKVDAADSAADMARKYYNNARNSYNAYKTEGQEETQALADATLANAEAGFNVIKAQLENLKVYAPIDGIVESVSVTALNPASPSSPAFVISNKEALSVSFNVPSASIAAMSVGGKVTVIKGQSSYEATITEVSTMINQQTGLFTVKATVDTADAPDLLTGVMVKVTAPTQKSENAILLSQDSVYFDDGKAYVYLAVDGRAVKTFVEIGISNPQQIEIVSGISDSDIVITTWHPDLIDGAMISTAS